MNRNSMRSLFVLIVLCAPMLSVQAQVTLPSPPPTPGSDWFGRSVGIDGSRLVVGAALYDPGTPERTNAGAAFVFVNQGGTWVQEAMLTAPEVALSAGDGFGQAIAIDGDRIAVGAYNAEPAAGPNSPGYAGAAYVFMRDTTTGTWNRTRLVPLDDQTQAWLGSTIDIDGDTIIVGAYNYDEGGYSNLNPGAIQNSGAAYIFQYDGTNWVQQARLAPPLADRVPQQRFGQSVAIDGDVALIGAYGPNNGIGDAYVSTRTGSTWSEPVKLPRSASQVNGGYGHTVALDFPNAMVSAVQHNPGGTNRVGAVHFYRYDSGSWSETALVVNPDPQHLAYFGFSLDILGDWAFVGARADNVGAVNSAGSVIVYRWDGTAWTYDRTLTSDAPLLNAFFGGAVSFDGTQLLVGE